jgi:hypothetical protein
LVPWSAAAKAPNQSEGSIRHGAGWAPLGADAGPWHHVAQSSQTSEQGRDDLHYRHRQACDAMERLDSAVVNIGLKIAARRRRPDRDSAGVPAVRRVPMPKVERRH